MKQFITRIELHGASESDYQKLHHLLGTAGFSRTIIADDGTEFHLPPAQYSSCGESSPQVRETARQAARMVGKPFAILVSETVSNAWVGLDKITPLQSQWMNGLSSHLAGNLPDFSGFLK
jgi:hypothetical protein